MKLDLFSIPIYICNIDTNKIKINNINFEKTWLSNTLSSHNFPNTMDQESAVYLLKTITNQLSSIIKESYSVKLRGIWENKYNKNDYQEKHDHPGSHFSFIIYKNVRESNTVFYNPSLKSILSYYNDVGINLFEESFTPHCRGGQMIIFPSFIEHMVLKHDSSETIAGNIIIEKSRG